MDRQERLAAASAAIQEAINNAVKIANELDGTIDVAPAYGMGGTYYSPGALKADLDYWTSQGKANWATVNNHEYYVSLESGGWVSSTMEC
ncbi:hypothetical protein MYO4S_00241 [Serratia phage 4S]|nr:hypothetical protein MYO4S_00241 [Serratia phage 4S]